MASERPTPEQIEEMRGEMASGRWTFVEREHSALPDATGLLRLGTSEDVDGFVYGAWVDTDAARTAQLVRRAGYAAPLLAEIDALIARAETAELALERLHTAASRALTTVVVDVRRGPEALAMLDLATTVRTSPTDLAEALRRELRAEVAEMVEAHASKSREAGARWRDKDSERSARHLACSFALDHAAAELRGPK